MNLEYLKKFIKEKKEQYPSLASKINDMYHLCLAEIGDGGSVQNEIDHCIFDIEEIIKEFEETIFKKKNMFKVTAKDVISTLVVIGLDVTIEKDGNEYDLVLYVKYENWDNFGTTVITWEVTSGDESILEEDDMRNQLDDFVQDYVLENIGKF